MLVGGSRNDVASIFMFNGSCECMKGREGERRGAYGKSFYVLLFQPRVGLNSIRQLRHHSDESPEIQGSEMELVWYKSRMDEGSTIEGIWSTATSTSSGLGGYVVF